MSSKKIYEAGRFLASRYAAGRWRGIGVDVVVTVQETQRHTLYGTSAQRHTLRATTAERQTLRGNTP